MGKYEKYIIRDPLSIVEPKFHHGATLNEFMSATLLPESKVTVHMYWRTEKTELSEKLTRTVTLPHTHDVDQVQIAIGEKDASEMEVVLGDETYKVRCPYAVYIPAGLSHTIVSHKILKPPVANATLILKGTYE